PATRRDRTRGLQPERPAGAVEEGGGRARQARYQDGRAVGRCFQAIYRRGARRQPAAHEGAHGEGRGHGELRQDRAALHTGLMNRGLTPIFVRLYDGVVYGMAYIAAFLMAAMMVVITLDVILRNLGYQSSAHFFTFTEYALLIVPCLGAPWLAREKG